MGEIVSRAVAYRAVRDLAVEMSASAKNLADEAGKQAERDVTPAAFEWANALALAAAHFTRSLMDARLLEGVAKDIAQAAIKKGGGGG